MAMIDMTGPTAMNAAAQAQGRFQRRAKRPAGLTRRGGGVDEGSHVARAGRMFVGVALGLAAFGLWLVPSSLGAPSLLLIKLGLSVAMLSCGLGLLSGCGRRDG